ncbi:hypothetical protein D3C83_95230 [compost metagenome]
MPNWPGFTRPTTSPGKARSIVSRLPPKKRYGRAARISCPSRALVMTMSFSNTPEHTRRNATRSRCRLFMFAWILNTKPLKCGVSGGITP